MRSTGSSRGSQGNRGSRGGRGNRAGRGGSRGEDQRGQAEPTMSESQPQSGTGQDPQAPAAGLVQHGTLQPAAPPTSRPGDTMHLGNAINPVGHSTSTTRNTSTAANPARAPSGVGPAIGSHGLQHPGLAAPPHNPLIRPPHAVPEPEGETCERCKNLNLRCDKNKPRCSHCLMGQHRCSLGEVLPSSHPSQHLPDPMEGLSRTTRNMSIASTPAQAPLGVGPGIGDHGEQYRGTIGPRPDPGTAQPWQQPKQDCYSCQNAKKKKKSCDRKRTCSNCIERKVPCYYEGQQILANEECYPCLKARKRCDGEQPCSYCVKHNLRCVYQEPAREEEGKFKKCEHCNKGDLWCDKKRPCSRCINDGADCHYAEKPQGNLEPAGNAGGTIRSSGVAPSQKEKYQACDNCRRRKVKCSGKEPCSRCIDNNVANCNYSENPNKFKTCDKCRGRKVKCDGKEPCSTCIKSNCGATCKYEEKHREEPTTSGREIDVEAIVPNVRIRREDHSEDLVYVHPPGHIRRPEGVAENMIIGWDRRGSWVIRPANGAGLLPGELGINDAGDRAIRVDEGEPAGEMGGMRDMRTAATTRRPPTQPQGFDAPVPRATTHGVQAHGVPGPSLAGRTHPRGSTESPPADDHHDLGKRQRRPPQT